MLMLFVLFPLFLLSLLASGIVILISGKGRRLGVAKTIGLLYAVGFALMVVLVVVFFTIGWITSPMEVDHSDVIGNYKVDKNMFAGPDADWQHEHFLMTITPEDTLILRSLDGEGNWHSFKRRIIPVRGVYSDLWHFETEGDTAEHHILMNTPTLHRQQWSFYYSFRSPRFGTVFFRKE